MNWAENSHQIISAVTLITWIAGFAFLALRMKVRTLDWVSLLVLGVFMVTLALDLFFLNRDLGGVQKIWARGWIGPRDQNGAITIGVLEDSLGISTALVGAMLGAVLIFNDWINQTEQFSERVYAGALLGVCGVGVAWFSLTPWLTILGMGIVALAGIVMLGARPEPELIAQFGQERTWGLLLSALGAGVLAGNRGALSLAAGFTLAPQSLSPVFDTVGGLFLVLGLYFYLQPLPFLDWLARSQKGSSVRSLLVCQGFSALSAFALSIRFESQIRELGIFEVFQWIALTSSLLTGFAGLAQGNWKTALPLWYSSILSFAFAALCFAGPAIAFPILLGSTLSAVVLSILASALEEGVLGAEHREWLKSLVLLGAALGMGVIGFVSCSGVFRTMIQAAQDPVHGALFSLTLLATNLLLWKSVFSILAIEPVKKRKTNFVVAAPLGSAGVLLVLSLGVLWTGTLSGGAIPNDPDRLFTSWLSVLFGPKTFEWVDDSGIAVGGGLYWAGLILSGLLSVWLFGRGQDLVLRGLEKSPRFFNFLRAGYSTDRLGRGIVLAGRKAGAALEGWVTEKVSVTWIPRAIEVALKYPAAALNRLDQRVYDGKKALLRQWVEVPAKTLQLIQNGDLQWYLVFAMGCVVAILIHFLKV